MAPRLSTETRDVAPGEVFVRFRRYRLPPDTSNYVPVGGNPFALRLATPGDLNEVRWLVHQAAKWLTRSKGTDQWAKPWPTRETRDQRLLRRNQAQKDVDRLGRRRSRGPRSPSPPGPCRGPSGHAQAVSVNVSDPAVYAHRLITARNYAGQGLGAELMDWAGLRGQRQYSAKWIRIDVWTSNAALHAYYQEKGFKRCGSCTDPDYPSGALFQKPVGCRSRGRVSRSSRSTRPPPTTQSRTLTSPPADPVFVAGSTSNDVAAGSGWGRPHQASGFPLDDVQPGHTGCPETGSTTSAVVAVEADFRDFPRTPVLVP